MLRTHEERHYTHERQRVYALYELAFTLSEFCASFLFIAGSVLTLQGMQDEAVWFFLTGSCFFATKPAIRLLREFHYLRIGRIQDLADRAP